MTLDLSVANATLGGLRPYPQAITTVLGDQVNGLMSLSAGSAGIIPEAPRAVIGITKFNHTHDMILESGVFAIHLLSNAPEMVDESMAILMALGGSSGRDGDKFAGLRTKVGLTGSPILLGALNVVECRVTGHLDNEENTLFVGDVVAAEKLNSGGRMIIGDAWARLPPEWLETYDRNHHQQVDHSRQMRGLPTVGHEEMA